jgi:hypothetical protein
MNIAISFQLSAKTTAKATKCRVGTARPKFNFIKEIFGGAG